MFIATFASINFLMMAAFSDSHISIATVQDIPALLGLLNNAYRGDASKKGWTTEAHLIAGNVRSDEATVKKVIEQPGSVMLVCSNGENEIAGCVNLQQHGSKIYLGMFAVNPLLQGGGIGKRLLHAAEEYAFSVHCNCIYMTVISVREELINWYKRHGYKDTGERKPFEDDGTAGRHLQALEFMVLEKALLQK
jgi:ribosomal protein S18 acetylase RimI-like enzyme